MAARELKNFVQFGRKIVGVGFNYRSLIRQLNIPEVAEPRIYLKAVSSYITKGQKIKIPEWSTGEVLYEVELGVVIGEPMKNVAARDVMKHVGGYCAALDMTDKGRLWQAREDGLAWDISKSFDTACSVGDLIPKDEIPDPTNVDLWLKLNGQMKQEGNTSDMTWAVPELISIMSRYFTLERGDLIITGTPGGMATVAKGDVIQAGLAGLEAIEFHVDSE